MLKVISVESLGTARKKVTLDEAIESAVNEFIGKDKELKSVNVSRETYTGSGFGRATVSIVYETLSLPEKKQA